MFGLNLREKSKCRWDLVALGEVMLRLDPGDNRIAHAREFRVWEGGGEYNVARGLKPCDIDWEQIFAKDGCRWLHTGGIFTALSETTPVVAEEAMLAAKKHGVIVSYDLNYRASLWKSHGGLEKAQAVNSKLVRLADVVFGNEEDFSAALGFAVKGVDEDLSVLDN